MSRKYTTQAKVTAYLSNIFDTAQINLDSSFSDQYDLYIEMATQMVESETARIFEADGSASIRLFEVKSGETNTIGRYRIVSRDVFIDDATEIGGMKVDGVDVESASINIYPANSTPKVRIHIKDTVTNVLTTGNQNIAVTAK